MLYLSFICYVFISPQFPFMILKCWGRDHEFVVTLIFDWNKAAFPAVHSLGGFVLFAINFVNVYEHVWKLKMEITKFRLQWNNGNITKPLSSYLLYGIVSNFDLELEMEGWLVNVLDKICSLPDQGTFSAYAWRSCVPSKCGLVKIADDQAEILIGHFPNTRPLSICWVLVY
jgi:hypothetical protein